jgi:hypothetical protein
MSENRVPFLAQFFERLDPDNAIVTTSKSVLGTRTATLAREDGGDIDESRERPDCANDGENSAVIGTQTFTKAREDGGDSDVTHTAVSRGASAGTSTFSAAKEERDTDEDPPLFQAPAWGATIL